MSWVLILNSDDVAKPPAVVGGYQTREAAEAAGDAATGFDPSKPHELPYYTHYMVIPGAASDGADRYTATWFVNQTAIIRNIGSSVVCGALDKQEPSA